MSGADGVQQQDPSFLRSMNGPRISERGAEVVSSRLQSIVSGTGAPADTQRRAANGRSNMDRLDSDDAPGDSNPAPMGRSYGSNHEPNEWKLATHVNPSFHGDECANSDVLVQGYEAHNRISNWQQPQLGHPSVCTCSLSCVAESKFVLLIIKLEPYW
jgi:hypothetical protein